MGTNISSCDPASIPNSACRSFFEALLPIAQSVPDKFKRANRVLVCSVYDSLRRVPSADSSFSLVVTGRDAGPLFLAHYARALSFPDALTRLSLRRCGLRSSHARSVAGVLLLARRLEQFDAGENSFGEGSSAVISAACSHPSLRVLILDGCRIPESATGSLIALASHNRLLDTLRVGPARVSPSDVSSLRTALRGNLSLRSTSISPDVADAALYANERNAFLANIVDSIARAPFQRQFRAKIESFKSVKGREMLMGRAGQKEQLRGTQLFADLEAVDARARTLEAQEADASHDRLRSGQAEMIGRRPNMEDVSIVLRDVPTSGAALYGLFDGHGGREAAEFAAANLPKAISDRLIATASYEDAYIASFRQLQMDMRPWCVYVGTTSVIAVIEGTTLTVANVGDSRCVLCRGGAAQRLSVDHKPDLPNETAYIQSKGGIVRDGRVGGMLAVSRALGDGFLGDAVNATPSVCRVELSAGDSFLILACDGVWDVLSDQEACDIVAPEIDPLVAARKLRDRAFELNSLDNISVIVVFLSDALSDKEE